MRKLFMIVFFLSNFALYPQTILFLSDGLTEVEQKRIFEEEAMGGLFETGYIVYNDAASEIMVESEGQTDNILSFAKKYDAQILALVQITPKEDYFNAEITFFRVMDNKQIFYQNLTLKLQKNESPVDRAHRLGREVSRLIQNS